MPNRERPQLPPPATSFQALKARILLSSLSSSSSGSSDAPLVPLLRLINAHPHHCTTSSCSGRVVVYAAADDDLELESLEFGRLGLGAAVNLEEGDGESSEGEEDEGMGKARSRVQNGKGGGSWLFVSHEEVGVPEEEHMVMKLLFGEARLIPYEDEAPLTDDETAEDLRTSWGGVVSFKFEAMVLHITSTTPTSSLPLLHAALSTGHAHSGLLPPSSALPNLLNPIPTPVPSEALSARLRSNLAIRSSSMNIDAPIARRVLIPSHRFPPSSTNPPPHSKISTSGEPEERPKVEAYKMLVPPSYLSYLLRQANLRMRSNLERISRLEAAFEEILD